MIKRTLYFGNPAYLSLKNEQLVVRLPAVEKNEDLPQILKDEAKTSIPVEDIGMVILDHNQVTITSALIESLISNNVAFITCDKNHHPNSLMLNLDGHHLQSARFKAQINASEPLKKQLWAQTIQQKIYNQAALLQSQNINVVNMHRWAKEVKSGDPENMEGRAAAFYWKSIFSKLDYFKQKSMFIRDRNGEPPNNVLNYGYAILRAITARNLVGSGLLPTLGIFHRNQYNAYCLADDIMEPYRPFVDHIVLNMISKGEKIDELSIAIKKTLLSLPTQDVWFGKEHFPLMIAMNRTTASLSNCFEGNTRKIMYPTLNEIQ
ncbi:MAG: type II CRISPR-associated endonuclease Cas1 [Bacteroidota bacterium]|nr:type II CRISPR-associated endonuclease Cas1 [Bacteroidota bacterium]